MVEMKSKEFKEEKSFNSNVYCLVGNIKDLREYGQNHELRTGIKKFAAGTKVYISLSNWGDGGEKVPALGRSRYKNGFIECIIRSEYIGNYRVKKIYSTSLINRMEKSEFDWWSGWTKEEIESIAKNRESSFQGRAFNVTKDMLLMNLNKITADEENIKRISNVLSMPKDKVLCLVKNYINVSNEIKRVDKNFIVINNGTKIIVNASNFKIITVKKL